MKYNKLKRYILMLIALAMLTSCFCFKAAAAEIDIYETESNNTMATADVTEDEADNLGRISSASDVDWYKITFDRGGKTNFWLGDIPSGCDYYMSIYSSSGSILYVVDSNTSSTSEYKQISTLANKTYYVKIASQSGYNASSYYLFSAKRYNIGEARFFTYNCNGINTRPAATNSMTHIWETGYAGQEYLNNGITPVYNSLIQCDMMTIVSNGTPGLVECPTSSTNNSYLIAKSSSSTSNNLYLSNLSSTALLNMRLIVFCSDYSGTTNSVNGNLVDMAYSKGACYSIGWVSYINKSDCAKWLGKFYEYCMLGENIYTAKEKTNTWMRENGANNINNITNQYYRARLLSATIN